VATVNAGASVILIDEPELSLHVDWQRRLVPSMRLLNPLAQLIVATHSPEIMAEIPDSNVFQI
jgi:predicted ATP-dependent endonuclease of OLD family